MPAEFHFIRPEWLLAIPVVIVLAVLLAKRQLGAGHWRGVVDAALMPHVLSRTAGSSGDSRWWLFGIAGVVAAVALAGPAWQRIDQPVFREDQALVVALDLSRSMDAQDVEPSRLSRARLKILSMLERRKSGQTALVVYTANAFTVTPLTDDIDTIAALVNSLSTDIMPSRGSYPEVGIRKGQALLEQAEVGYGEVLLITDGGTSPAAEKAARDLVEAGFALSVLGVGTREGAPVPRMSGGFVTDNRGKIAVARLEERGLRDLAVAGGGRFSVLTADDSDVDYLLSGEVRAAAAGSDSLTSDQWREEGPWLVLILLPLAALAFRKGWVLVLVVFVAPLPAQASLWDDLWLTKDQQARSALENGEAADAAAVFEDTEWRGVARYRAGDYAGSAREFAESGDTRNLYNLGNAMAQQGNFDAAIDTYEEVLEMEPDHDDARYNLELVKKLREQQEQEEQQAGDDQQSTQNPGGDGEQSDGEGEQTQQGSEGESQESQDGDGQQRDEEMSEEDLEALRQELQRAAEEQQQGDQPQQLSEAELAQLRQQQEQQQAMEQWLRRIPDDPGGLLRRKFRSQYQRYRRDQDGNELWPDDEVQPW
ncbi:MAG: VWA domain-containing protein [Gammaproteobacteria bacterium]|nr:VWA domain-containing protein [Gammaproteobacteria bacterium]MBT8093825.1 VWA domain-containing protein [Gammaproteobacteria bacterium]MBT8105909.1 VWA domain-containing protein [Gammaproteobacteria bacterium]NNF48813.1 VWA domain-containing protein [Woeseiaceae bacterium]NNK25923.1 VWA domain-containing protein [Woeseiaceae bacterium]